MALTHILRPPPVHRDVHVLHSPWTYRYDAARAAEIGKLLTGRCIITVRPKGLYRVILGNPIRFKEVAATPN
jgi:hypothetical protein